MIINTILCSKCVLPIQFLFVLQYDVVEVRSVKFCSRLELCVFMRHHPIISDWNRLSVARRDFFKRGNQKSKSSSL